MFHLLGDPDATMEEMVGEAGEEAGCEGLQMM